MGGVEGSPRYGHKPLIRNTLPKTQFLEFVHMATSPAGAVALRDVSLDDKYELDSGRAYMTGMQALVRLPMMQRQRDAAAGLNTAGFVSGYRGSPLGGLDQALWSAEKFLTARAHQVPARPQRGPRGDRGLGHAAGQPVSRRQVRRRVLHVVRQGPRRRPLRRRVQARQLRRHVASTAACWCWPATTTRRSRRRCRTSPTISSPPR